MTDHERANNRDTSQVQALHVLNPLHHHVLNKPTALLPCCDPDMLNSLHCHDVVKVGGLEHDHRISGVNEGQDDIDKCLIATMRNTDVVLQVQVQHAADG